MANRIREIEFHAPNATEDQANAVRELLNSVAASRDALKMFVEIVKEAHEAGLLDILHGLLKSRHEVGFLAMKQLNQPNMHHMIKNAMGALTFLGQVEPQQLGKLLKGISQGIDRAAAQGEPKQALGIWGLSKAIRDPDVNAALQTAVEFARGMGEQMRAGSQGAHEQGSRAGGVVH